MATSLQPIRLQFLQNNLLFKHFFDGIYFVSVLYRIIQIVMRKCVTDIVEHLEPDHVLDLFQEKDVFKPLSKSKVKDMRVRCEMLF